MTEGIDVAQDVEGVPVAHIATAIDDLPQAYRTLGDFLNEPAAYDLADYVAQMLVTFAQGREQLTSEMRKKVYFGQGADGLNTRVKGSLLDDILTMIGADNAACDLTEEQSFNIDPSFVNEWGVDLAVLSVPECGEGTESRELIRSIWRDTDLSYGRDVLLIPMEPFGWLDRSPLTMQTLGALWLANALYPEIYSYNMGYGGAGLFQPVLPS